MQRRRRLTAAELERLDAHFCKHTAVVERFRHASRANVIRMWRNRTNERGEPLTAFEREALVERHCELFGCWPE
jgi:hypothetical protein